MFRCISSFIDRYRADTIRQYMDSFERHHGAAGLIIVKAGGVPVGHEVAQVEPYKGGYILFVRPVPDLKKKSSKSSSCTSVGSGTYRRNLQVGSELATVYETLEDYDDVSLGSVAGSVQISGDTPCNCLDRRCRKQSESLQGGNASGVHSPIYDLPAPISPLCSEGGYDQAEAVEDGAAGGEPATLVVESSNVVVS